jgi:hypothetical protein
MNARDKSSLACTSRERAALVLPKVAACSLLMLGGCPRPGPEDDMSSGGEGGAGSNAAESSSADASAAGTGGVQSGSSDAATGSGGGCSAPSTLASGGVNEGEEGDVLLDCVTKGSFFTNIISPYAGGDELKSYAQGGYRCAVCPDGIPGPAATCFYAYRAVSVPMGKSGAREVHVSVMKMEQGKSDTNFKQVWAINAPLSPYAEVVDMHVNPMADYVGYEVRLSGSPDEVFKVCDSSFQGNNQAGPFIVVWLDSAFGYCDATGAHSVYASCSSVFTP